jgi:predicted AAA+ superfamily ATPase
MVSVQFSWYDAVMIGRPQRLDQIRRALKRSRIIALIGPRQCGKTTLARQVVPFDSVN